MRKVFYLLSVLIPFISIAQRNENYKASQFTNQLARQGIRFTENKGQVADLNGKIRPDILFTAHSQDVKLFITSNGIHYQFSRVFEKKKGKAEKKDVDINNLEIDSTQFYGLDMKLIGANKPTQIIKEEVGSDYENFYLAHCPNGVLGVKNYGRIIFKNVYQNIDWVIYNNDGKMEYDFILHPGAGFRNIKMKYDGAISMKLVDNGSLKIGTPLGTVQEHAPLSLANGKQIQSNFLLNNQEISFDVHGWNGIEELKIDPSVEWGTYYGGESGEKSNSSDIDVFGNYYVAGSTYSNTLISWQGFQNVKGGSEDAFVVKFNESGNRLWATYYGGTAVDEGNSCSIDKWGNVYLAGYTQSLSGISFMGFQNSFGGGYSDGFLMKLNSAGVRKWATYYGNIGGDNFSSCSVDTIGNIYTCGSTSSISGIAFNGFQNVYGGGTSDGFIVRFDSSGTRAWSSYFGGEANDELKFCKTFNSGAVYFAGKTNSLSNINANGSQAIYGGGTSDGIILKLSNSGSRIWSSYYGGNFEDYIESCVVDFADNLYLTGTTASTSGIAYKGFQNTPGAAFDAFIVKFNSAGNRIWGTYFGGENEDYGNASVVDSSGNVYIAGSTKSTTAIAYHGLQAANMGFFDAFLLKVAPNGNRIWSGYYGGESNDFGNALNFSRPNILYISGETNSATNIAKNGFKNTYGYFGDAFAVKIIDCISAKPKVNSNQNPLSVCPKDSIILISSLAPSYLWNNGANTRYITVKASGNYFVTTTDSNGCQNYSDTMKVAFQHCTTPTDLFVSSIRSTSARLNWDNDTCAVGYKYGWRAKGNFTWEFKKTKRNTAIISGLLPNTIYEWLVFKQCNFDSLRSEAGSGPDFTTLSFTSPRSPLTSSNNLGFAILPNPTTSNTTVILSNKNQNARINVMDADGKVVWQTVTSESNIIIPSQRFARGVYVVMVWGDNTFKNLKLIKQ